MGSFREFGRQVAGSQLCRRLSVRGDDEGVGVAHRLADVFAAGMEVGSRRALEFLGTIVCVGRHHGFSAEYGHHRLPLFLIVLFLFGATRPAQAFDRRLPLDVAKQILDATTDFLNG